LKMLDLTNNFVERIEDVHPLEMAESLLVLSLLNNPVASVKKFNIEMAQLLPKVVILNPENPQSVSCFENFSEFAFLLKSPLYPTNSSITTSKVEFEVGSSGLLSPATTSNHILSATSIGYQSSGVTSPKPPAIKREKGRSEEIEKQLSRNRKVRKEF